MVIGKLIGIYISRYTLSLSHQTFSIPSLPHSPPPLSFASQTRKLVSEVPTGSALTHLQLHPGSALCATASDDLTLRLFDIEAARLVRRFKGHR